MWSCLEFSEADSGDLLFTTHCCQTTLQIYCPKADPRDVQRSTKSRFDQLLDPQSQPGIGRKRSGHGWQILFEIFNRQDFLL